MRKCVKRGQSLCVTAGRMICQTGNSSLSFFVFGFLKIPCDSIVK